jgi:hypothetical protein
MRAFYYDEVFEPPKFYPATDAPDFEFVADAETIEIGDGQHEALFNLPEVGYGMPNLAVE